MLYKEKQQKQISTWFFIDTDVAERSDFDRRNIVTNTTAKRKQTKG
jgi:hypothetical protein